MKAKTRPKSSRQKLRARKTVSRPVAVRQARKAKALQSGTAEFHRSLRKVEETVHDVEHGIHRVHKKADRVHQKMRGTANAFPIVGIGASAGGFEAMTQLLKRLPRSTGMAFVLVQHLDPTHESQLTSLLSRLTEMKVSEATNKLLLEPDHLYILPPNKGISISRRRLRLKPRTEESQSTLPIDYFLISLAREQGEAAIGVILSGNGSDGTLGLQAIKAAGGIAFAQEKTSAKFSGMPGSAIAARCVDFVLPPDKIARELTRIAGHSYVAPGRSVNEVSAVKTEQEAFDDILVTLRYCTGVDFTHYKRPTLERRIERRMVLHRFDNLKDYAGYVHGHTAEVTDLYNDILIHVTEFFRDPAVFTALKQRIFPCLLKVEPTNEPIRIWIPGCSTGEEVYSIAITLLESLAERPNRPIQIFGTDINEQALEKARAGRYAGGIQGAVSAERLRRFFTRHDGGWRINKSIRELCIFARQNVVTDPPFSNLDFISCRNLLIYLGLPLQRKIMPVFHYALKPTGLLMLGGSETIGNFAELFGVMDKNASVYFKKTTSARPAIIFSPYQRPGPEAKNNAAPPGEPAVELAEIQKQADRIQLSQFSPAGVIINREMEVLQFRGRTGTFLEHAHGEANLNLLKMARDGLAADLRATVSKAMKQNVRVREEGARVKQDGGFLEVIIEVVPFQTAPSREWFYLVVLNASPHPVLEQHVKRPRGKASRLRRTDLELDHLREQLADKRESLQAIIEEQEATNEELRSANEEITSSNEELQSTNEELETAREELQSTNEELTTLNEELEIRNTEMTHVNDDLHNILASIHIPMLILGRDLRIRRFTAAAEKLFSLIRSDVGRPITDIVMKVEMPDLPAVVTEVIDTLAAKDLETRDRGGRFWSVRIRPYKTSDNKIDGAIIVLMDIDALKRSLKQSDEARVFAEAIVNTVREPLVVLGKDLVIQSVNNSFLRTFRVNPDKTLGERIYNLGNGQWNIPRLRELLEEILPKDSQLHDFEVEHDFPLIGFKKMLLNARRLSFDDDKQPMILLAIEEVAGQAKA
jgi:two-component system, chemotaxis family, CheB/CheR fusion protein